MPTAIVRLFRLGLALAATALFLHGSPPAGADERADLHAALRQATAQYRIAMRTLETLGRDETAAEVARFRAALQAVIEHVDAQRTAVADQQDYASRLMQLDTSIVGIMIVIDIGSREAARAALAPIGSALAELSARADLPE